MSKKIAGVLIDTKTNIAKTAIIDDTLSAWYAALHCTCIDIVERTIGSSEKYYCIVCDDEGLMKETPCVSAVDKNGQIALVGSLFIAKYDRDSGELASLSPQEIHYVMDHTFYVLTCSHQEPRCLLCQVDY